MKSKLIVKPAAQLEFDEAVDWYCKQSPQLATKLTLEVHRVFESICKQPEIFGLVSKNVRFARTHTFSYAIYFYVEESQVFVIAILHTSRDPAILQGRIP